MQTQALEIITPLNEDNGYPVRYSAANMLRKKNNVFFLFFCFFFFFSSRANLLRHSYNQSIVKLAHYNMWYEEQNYFIFNITRKEVFFFFFFFFFCFFVLFFFFWLGGGGGGVRFILNENILFWSTTSYQKPFVFTVSVFCPQIFTLQ